MARAMSTQDILRLAEGTDPYLAGVRNLVDTCKYHLQAVTVGAGALPAQIQFFNVSRAPGVCNLELVSQVVYPLFITHIGMQIFGAGADVRITSGRSEVVIQKDNRQYAAFRSNWLMGGGGLTMQYSPGAGAAVDFATQGLGNDFFSLPAPIMIMPDQVLNVFLNTDGTAVGAATSVAIMLRGVESRTVI